MAHGWDSYFHNLQPASVNPNPLRTSGSEGSLSQQVGNFVGHHDFTTVVSNETPATNANFNQNCYSNPSIGNSSSDCVYQSYYKESQWQADAEHMEKNDLLTCGNSNNIPDFSMDTLSASGSYQDFATDLQDCEMLAPAFLEEFSDVSSCSDADFSGTRPSCKYMENNSFLKTEVPTKQSSSEWLIPQTENITCNNKSLSPNVSEKKIVSQSQHDMQLGENINCAHDKTESYTSQEQPLATSNVETDIGSEMVDDGNFSDGCQTQKQIEDIVKDVQEKKTDSLSGHDTTLTGDGTGEYQNVTEEDQESHYPNPQNFQDTHVGEDEDDKIGVSKEENKDSGSSKDGEDSLIPNGGENEASSSESCTFDHQKSPNPNFNDSKDVFHQPVECISTFEGYSNDVELRSQIPEHKSHESIAQDNICGSSIEKSSDDVRRASDKKEQSDSAYTESNSEPENSNSGINPCQGEEWTDGDPVGSHVSTNTPLMDTNDTPVQDVSNGVEPCTHSNDSSACQTPCPQNERKSPSENKDSLNQDNTLHQNTPPVPLKQESVFRDVAEDSRESFKESDVSTEEQELGILYGEPLSGEDSSFDADETNFDLVQNKNSEQKAPQLKLSIQMQKRLCPVVILKTLEPVKGMSNSYHCADCQTTTPNIDMLIEHHHSCHSDHNFQFCKRCNVYQMTSEQADKHECDVIKETPRIPDSSLKKKKRHKGGHRCSRCGLIFSKITHFVKHMRAHTGKTPYKCNKCGIYFSQAACLKRHNNGRCKNRKPPITNNNAVSRTKVPSQEECSKPNESMSRCYVKLVDIFKTKRCCLCGKSFSSAQMAKKHFFDTHWKNSLPFLSSKCTKKVSSKNRPKVDDEDRDYKCVLCPRRFKYSYNRARHLRDCIRGFLGESKEKHDPKYQCPLCNATFTTPSNRYRHINTTCFKECLSTLAKQRATSSHDAKKKKQETKPKTLSMDTQQKTQPKETQQKTGSKETQQKMKSKGIEQKSMAKISGHKKRSRASTASKGIPRYKCYFCPAVFCHGSGKYRHMKKHKKVFNFTGQIYRYSTLLSTIPKPADKSITNSSKAENCKDNVNSVEASNSTLTLSCHFCGKTFGTSQSLKKHESSHRGERPYRCLECGKGFKKRWHLINHKVVHRKRIQCTVCQKTFSTIGDLIQHRRTHPKRGMLTCPQCDMEFKFPAYLVRHLEVHKKKESKMAKLKEELTNKPPQQSSESMEGQLCSEQLQCSLCKESFNDAKMLRKHCLTHISRSSSHQCPFCKRNCSNRRLLLRHMIIHTGHKAFSCNNCGKQFYRSWNLKLHSGRCLPTVNRHLVDSESSNNAKGSKKCPICARVFTRKGRLKNHVNGHKANTLIQCSRCGQYYGHGKLRRHENQCAGMTTELSSTRCSYCPRVFMKKNRLKNHLLGHKNNTLLQCPRCRQYFGRTRLHLHHNYCTGTSTGSSLNSNLKTHSQISHKINPISSESDSTNVLKFKCSYCTRRYRYKSLLLRHIFSHTGIQPYLCKHCGHGYRSRSSCLQHEAFCVGNTNKEQLDNRKEALAQMSMVSDVQEAVQKTGTGEDEFKCKFCTKTFKKPRNLRRHILTHNEVKPYRCKACDSCFSRYDHLKVHQAHCKGKKQRLEVCIPKISLDDIGKGWQNKFAMKSTAEQETFDCKVCSKTFLSQSKLSRHNTLFHTIKMFKCNRCGTSFAHEKSLKHHRKVNRCRRFSKETNTSLSLSIIPAEETVTEPPNEDKSRILRRLSRYQNKKYPCSDCPCAFGKRWQLRVHRRVHTGEKPYPCQYCGLKFMRKDYVQRHFPKCTKKNQNEVLCDKCGGLFPQFQIEDHQNNCTSVPTISKPAAHNSQQSGVQSPPKGFSCAYCNARFLLFSQLQEHFLNAHKMETMVPPLSTAPLQQHLSNMPEINKEGLHDSCGKKLIDGANLICNLDTTLDREPPKPLSCPKCHMLFANKAGLGGHMRIHDMNRPFTCMVCKKGFWNKNHLSNHTRKCGLGCNSDNNANQQIEVPLKAEIDFAINDSVLVFKEGSQTTGMGVLQTNFSHKDELMDESPQSSGGSQVQGKCQEKKAVQYQCSECDQSFTDGLMLISHLEDHGREEEAKRRNVCTKCGRVCSSKGNLEKHMRMHGTDKKYPCRDASSDLASTGHDSNSPFFCKLCDQRFSNRVSLCNHYSEDHPEDAFKCRFCNKSYSVKKSLARHYKKWHLKEQRIYGSTLQENDSSEEKSSTKNCTSGESDEEKNAGSEDSDSDSAPYFPCHVCGKTFPTSESLEDHQRCHLGEKPHECADCGKCFYQASQLQQHQRMHKSEFQCQACGRGFVSLFALRKHKHTHGKSRPYRCSKCHLSFTGPSQLAEHMYSHREENFPCDICNRVFHSKSSRAEHRKSHSKSSGCHSPSVSVEQHEKSGSLTKSSSGFPKEFKYRCGVCSKLFKDPEDLSEHGCFETNERPYSCLDCKTYFLHASHLKKHRSTKHPSYSGFEYPCSQCSHSFSSTQQFFKHLMTHLDTTTAEVERNAKGPLNSIICPVCHLKFGSATELISHFPPHMDGTFECKICRLEFPSKSKLEEHNHVHLLLPQLECIECGHTFHGRDAFLKHRFYCQQQTNMTETSQPSAGKSPQTHQATGEEEEVDVTGDDIFCCPICLMQFSSKSLLLEHQNKHHPNNISKEKPFTCELCGKTFALRRYLREHERRHRQKSISQNKAQSVEKRLKCTQCNAEFSLAQDLSLHMRVHAEEEAGQLRCDMCNKSFSQWSLLKQHQESHIGQVVYECTECDKAFAFPHLLEEHQQNHA